MEILREADHSDAAAQHARALHREEAAELTPLELLDERFNSVAGVDADRDQGEVFRETFRRRWV